MSINLRWWTLAGCCDTAPTALSATGSAGPSSTPSPTRACSTTSPSTASRLAHQHFGLTPAELVQLARNGVDAAFCPDHLKAAIHAEIDTVSSQADVPN